MSDTTHGGRSMVTVVDASIPATASGEMANGPAAPSQPASPQSGMTLPFVWDAVVRWWKYALPAGILLAAAASIAILFVFRPQYVASAWVQLQESPIHVAFESRDNRADRFVQTQIELMRSPKVLERVISEPDVARIPELAKAENKVEWLAKTLQIKRVGQSELYTISFASANPKNSATLVNAVVDEYFRLRGLDEGRRNEIFLQILAEEQNNWKVAVEKSREEVREKTMQATGKDPYGPKSELDPLRQNPLAELQKLSVTAAVEREVAEARLKSLRSVYAKQPVVVPEEWIAKEINANPEVQRLKTMVMFEKSQLEELKNTLARGEQDPTYQRQQTKLTEDEATLSRTVEAARKEAKAVLEKEMAGRRRDELASLEVESEMRQVQEQSLKNRYETELKSLQKGSGETLELQFKRAELDRAQQVLDLIAKRLTAIKTEQRAPSRVSRVEEAKPADAPIETYPLKKLGIAVLAGLFAPFALAIFWERNVRRVIGRKDLEQESRIAVLGEVARLPVRKHKTPASATSEISDELRVFEESIDSLRTNLFLSQNTENLRVLAVTSAQPHEGKTSVAVSLAVSLARSTGQPTILIDGDMRSPGIHEIFEIRSQPGLAEVLRGESRLADAIVATSSSNLHILTAGELTTSPHRLLGNGTLESLLAEIPSHYRYVVIDTPPVLEAAESLVFARKADGCLVCAMRGISRGDHVQIASERLQASGCRVVGTVLNGVHRRRYGYSQRYGYS